MQQSGPFFGALVLATLTAIGCLSSALAAQGKPAAEPSHAQENGNDQPHALLNQGYSLLYADVSDLRFADKLLLVKLESDDTDRMVSDIANYASQLTKQLEVLPRRYPSLRIDLEPLPDVEARKLRVVKKARILSFAPIFGRSGPEFERTLLLSLSAVLNQLRFMCQVIAEEESDAERKKQMNQAEESLSKRYWQTLDLLERRYYRAPT